MCSLAQSIHPIMVNPVLTPLRFQPESGLGFRSQNFCGPKDGGMVRQPLRIPKYRILDSARLTTKQSYSRSRNGTEDPVDPVEVQTNDIHMGGLRGTNFSHLVKQNLPFVLQRSGWY